MTRGGQSGAAALIVARGSRMLERRVLGDLDTLLAADQGGSASLSAPIRVVVPSQSLRERVITALLRSRGRAVAGIIVQTLHGLAREVLQRMGEPPSRGADLFGVLVERAAADDALLRSELGSLSDGYGTLVGTVRDLLDAGFDETRREELVALVGALASAATEREVERGRAIVNLAARVVEAMRDLGVGREADLLRRAARLLDRYPERALPARAVLVHGFAEATGTASELLAALASARRARLYMDEPPDPAEPMREDLGVSFARRLQERLIEGPPDSVERAQEDTASEPRSIDLFRAPARGAEVREVARRVRALLDDGVEPESVAVVARTLDPYQAAIYQHFHRLGVPFSCRGAAGLQGPEGSLARGLLEVIRLGGRAPLDAWLAVVAQPPGKVADLRVGLRVLGVTRLDDLRSLDLAQVLDRDDRLPLPVRQGLEVVGQETEGEDDNGRARAPRRRVAGQEVREVASRAGRTLDLLAAWPATAQLSRHLELLHSLLTDALAWHEELAGAGDVRGAATALGRELPGEVELRREEVASLLRGRLREAGRRRLGGAGGGVQVMAVVEARAWVFEHLFVIGLNRGVFPRVVREDPLLPDSLREAMATALPEMPRKRTGHDEERYLFAQLIAASPRVTLSWLLRDDRGRPMPVSPLVERLLVGRARGSVVEVGDPQVPPPSAANEVCPAHELATIIGLYGTREQLAGVLPVALAETFGASASPIPVVELAAARMIVLEELDPDVRTRAGWQRSLELGPYFGFVGRRKETGDPRQVPAITTIEEIARCPWRSFLARLLRIEAAPDFRAGLGDVDGRLIGDVVHGVLERIVREAGAELGSGIASAVGRQPVEVPWPPPERVREIVAEEAWQGMRRAGIALPGVHVVLQERVRPYVDVARDTDWAGGTDTVGVVGVEIEGETQLRGIGEHRRVSFRADRVDAVENGLCLVDYKTGRPALTQTTEAGRRRGLLKKLGAGEVLQVVAYGAADVSTPVEGRLLYLRPDLDEGVERALVVSPQDDEARQEGALAVRAVLEGWEAGSFFPRLTKPDRPEAPAICQRCEVRQACLQPDTGARIRLARRMALLAESQYVRGGAAERAAAGIWSLAVAGKDGEGKR